MAYGKIKADTFVYDNSGSDVEVTLSSLGNKAGLASPTFTGTVTIPTPAANDNTTKAASTAYVQTELGDYALKASPTFTGTVNAAALTLSGNLQVNGTTTTVASSTMTVTDKNIEIAKGAANDAAADGAGITVDSGDGDKTWNWVNATDAWTSSEHIHLGDSKELKIGTGEDLKISHGGSDSRIINTTGDLKIRSQSLKLETTDAQEYIRCTADQDVKLFYDNVQKFNTSAAGVTVTGTVSDSKGDVRKIIQNYKSTAYTLVAADSGKHVSNTAGITVPASVFSEGDAVTLINRSGSDITITQGTGVNMYNSADASTGNRTLAGRGMATLLFTASASCYISGAGLS